MCSRSWKLESNISLSRKLKWFDIPAGIKFCSLNIIHAFLFPLAWETSGIGSQEFHTDDEAPCSAFHWVMLGFKFLRVNNSQSKATRISVGLRHQYGISRVQSQSSPEAEERLTQRKTPELGFCYNISL